MTKETTKRRNFTLEEDIILLRQINADQPFAYTRGKMEKWDETAVKIVQSPSFSRALSGKSCQSRFNSLLDKHKTFNSESAKASGCSEEYNEKIVLLDELQQLYDEWQKTEATRSDEEKVKKEQEKKKAEVIREQALARLKEGNNGKRTADNPEEVKTPKKLRGMNKLVSMLEEDTEVNKYRIDMEMQTRIKEKQLDLEFRQKEREEERKERLEIQQKENDKFIEMMKVIMGAINKN
jgi:hypothetical protein